MSGLSDDDLADFTVREVTLNGIAKRLYLSERTVETHVASILAKLDLANTDQDHRRVLAVVAYLRGARDAGDQWGLSPMEQ